MIQCNKIPNLSSVFSNANLVMKGVEERLQADIKILRRCESGAVIAVCTSIGASLSIGITQESDAV